MEISIAAEKIGEIYGLDITNSMLTSIIASLILIIIAIIFRLIMNLKPGKIQNAIEIVFDFLINQIENVFGSFNEAKKYFPLLATIFLFIIVNNWLGILPGIGTIGIYETIHGKEILVPYFRSGNADLNTTIALALITIICVQIFGMLAIGVSKYLGKFFNFKNPIYFSIGILEIISEFSRIISFSFRLFGNVFAGEVLLIIIAKLMPYFAPLPFYILEIFVGFIQALVFTMLAMVFIRMATLKEEH